MSSYLTDYYREEFGRFRIFFNLKKVPKLDNFRVKFVIFPGEKVVVDVCYDRSSSSNWLRQIVM